MRWAYLSAGAWSFVCSVVASGCMERPVVATEPVTSNLYVEPVSNEVIDKLDLLFMIDNSASMGDKQKLLAEAVPQLVDRLVVPRCVGSGGVHVRTSLEEKCPPGTNEEFRAVRDIHIAVITSSLGAHGATHAACQAGEMGHPDDRGLLLPSVRTGLASYNNSGFLAWDPEAKQVPPGENDAARLGTQFGDMVKAAGEDGCGYEASLESWYRFLIDPEPPATLGRTGTAPSEQTIVTSIDEQVLAQREAFLRPDSLVAIVMLTDENDCSIRDDGWGYMLEQQGQNNQRVMWRGNSACAKDPNDSCCVPCAAAAPQGCLSTKDDPVCQGANNTHLAPAEDHQNMRCWENKRRFGYDFLYPTSRYVDALTKLQVIKRSTGMPVDNPLFAPGPNGNRRDFGLVYLAGIVGVPWQDIADNASLTGAGLRYLTAKELSATGRWDVLVGDRSKGMPPADPFMVESIAARSGTNPVTGDVIAPATSDNPRANAINGHELVAPDGGELQYACTFPLKEAVPCKNDASCDCEPKDVAERRRPLCQPPGGGGPEPTQYFGKAYPGIRPLEVLKGIGDSAIVASICPKVFTVNQPGYGYEPAVDALIDRFKVVLNGRCLPRPLAVASSAGGELPCVVVEASPVPDGGSCDCSAASRSPASASSQESIRRRLAERGQCDTADTKPCSSFCLCELAPSKDEALNECLNSVDGPETPGYCYVHPFDATPAGNPELVASCEEGKKQLLRFVGPDTPKPGATTFVACLGATLH